MARDSRIIKGNILNWCFFSLEITLYYLEIYKYIYAYWLIEWMNQSEKWEIFYSVNFIKFSIHVLFYFHLFIVLVVFVIQEEYSEKRKGGYGKSRNRWIFWTKFQYGICVEHIYDCKSYVFQWLRNVFFWISILGALFFFNSTACALFSSYLCLLLLSYLSISLLYIKKVSSYCPLTTYLQIVVSKCNQIYTPIN